MGHAANCSIVVGFNQLKYLIILYCSGMFIAWLVSYQTYE